MIVIILIRPRVIRHAQRAICADDMQLRNDDALRNLRVYRLSYDRPCTVHYKLQKL